MTNKKLKFPDEKEKKLFEIHQKQFDFLSDQLKNLQKKNKELKETEIIPCSEENNFVLVKRNKNLRGSTQITDFYSFKEMKIFLDGYQCKTEQIIKSLNN